MNDGFERRDFIHGVGLLASAAAVNTLMEWPAVAQTTSATGQKPLIYDIKALSLDPKSIKGISEKVLVSHYEKYSRDS